MGLVVEVIDYNEYLTGKRTEGVIYGTLSLTCRVSQTISQSLAVLMIGWIVYTPELTNADIMQANGTILGIKVITSVVPAVAVIGSCLCFKSIWNLDGTTGKELSVWRNSMATPLAEAEVMAVETVQLKMSPCAYTCGDFCNFIPNDDDEV